MMDAIHIELFDTVFDELVMNTSRRMGFTSEDLYANSDEFETAVNRAGFRTPIAAAPITDSRFRLYLKVPGFPKLTGVYYVSGWADSRGTVSLSRDPEQGYIVPKRREAIMATKRLHDEIEVVV